MDGTDTKSEQEKAGRSKRTQAAASRQGAEAQRASTHVQFPCNRDVYPAGDCSQQRVCNRLGHLCFYVPRTTLLDFGSATIVIERRSGKARTCRPHGLYGNTTSEAKQTCVDHLLFDRFLRVLVDEFQYDTETDVLFYNMDTGQRIDVLTERAWRTAMWDMYGKGWRNLVFWIDRNSELGNSLCCLADVGLTVVYSKQDRKQEEPASDYRAHTHRHRSQPAGREE